MSFEAVDPRPGPKPDATSILAIYPSGEGRLNTAATQRYVADAERAIIYTDAERRRLALSATTTDDGVALMSKKRAKYLALRSALDELGVDWRDIDTTVRLRLAYDNASGLVVADCTPLFREVER